MLIDKPGTNKKHWSAAEDKTLLELVDKDGPRNWARIAKGLGTARSGPSCCARWCRLAGPKAGASLLGDALGKARDRRGFAACRR